MVRLHANQNGTSGGSMIVSISACRLEDHQNVIRLPLHMRSSLRSRATSPGPQTQHLFISQCIPMDNGTHPTTRRQENQVLDAFRFMWCQPWSTCANIGKGFHGGLRPRTLGSSLSPRAANKARSQATKT